MVGGCLGLCKRRAPALGPVCYTGLARERERQRAGATSDTWGEPGLEPHERLRPPPRAAPRGHSRDVRHSSCSAPSGTPDTPDTLGGAYGFIPWDLFTRVLTSALEPTSLPFNLRHYTDIQV